MYQLFLTKNLADVSTRCSSHHQGKSEVCGSIGGLDYIRFASSSARSSRTLKLVHVHVHSKSSLSHNCYFSRVVRLWDALLPIDLNSSYCSIKQQLKRLFWSHFLTEWKGTTYSVLFSSEFFVPKPYCISPYTLGRYLSVEL